MMDEYIETELGTAPINWNIRKIGDVAILKNGINFSKEQKGDEGILTIDVFNMYSKGIGINNENLYRIKKEVHKEYILEDGDILFVRSSLKREGVGWASLFRKYTEPVTFCGFIIRARLIGSDIYPEFLVYYLRTKTARESLIASSGKVAITNINQGLLGNIQFPIPPLAEQQKISAVLSAVQEAKEKTGEVIRAAKELKKSLMNHLFTYGPVPPQEAPNVKLKETEIGLIPEEWKYTKIKDIGETITGTTPSTKQKENYGNEYMFISPVDINENKYIKRSSKYISKKGYEVSRPLPKDTVLVGCIGTIGKIGMTFVDNCTTNQQINAVIPNNLILPHFLYYALSHRSSELKSLAGKVTIPIVNKSNFEKFLIHFPGLSIQKKIADILSSIDQKIEAEENKKTALDNLFKTLLENLMTGKTRVNHLDIPIKTTNTTEQP